MKYQLFSIASTEEAHLAWKSMPYKVDDDTKSTQ